MKWRIKKIGRYFRIVTPDGGILAARTHSIETAIIVIGKIERRRTLRLLKAI